MHHVSFVDEAEQLGKELLLSRHKFGKLGETGVLEKMNRCWPAVYISAEDSRHHPQKRVGLYIIRLCITIQYNLPKSDLCASIIAFDKIRLNSTG